MAAHQPLSGPAGRPSCGTARAAAGPGGTPAAPAAPAATHLIHREAVGGRWGRSRPLAGAAAGFLNAGYRCSTATLGGPHHGRVRVQ